MRINEVAQLKVSDVFYPTGELKSCFVIPGTYTKTSKPRPAYIKVKQQREALLAWMRQRLDEKAFLSNDGAYGGLRGDGPLFLSKKGRWRTFSFNVKKYEVKKYEKEGGEKETRVCSSLENTVRELIKKAGFRGGSSHSGRRTMATLMYRKEFDLDIIQKILGHESEEMTLEYIDPDIDQINNVFKTLWIGVKQPNFDGIR